MSKSTDEDLVFRRRPSLIVTRASTPDARFKPVQDEPTGAESGAPGLSHHRRRYQISSEPGQGDALARAANMRGTMFAIWGANRSGSMPCSMRSSWTSAAPNYRAIGSESMRPSGPDVERRRQRGIAGKAVDIRAITTSELEFSASIDEEYAELAVRTPHPPYRLDARG